MSLCPCGTNMDYADCCEPVINGNKIAATAEELMRARYSAHDKVAVDFLYNSTHPDYRTDYDHKGTKSWAEKSQWLGLEVVATSVGSADDERGEVEFIARFRDKGVIRNHHERGHFAKVDNHWLFTEGEMIKSPPVTVSRIGRNDPCSCGSGKKFKKCCGQ